MHRNFCGVLPGYGLEDFQFLKSIGKGGFGEVWKVLSNIKKEIFCIKIIDTSELNEEKIRLAISEVIMLRKLSHPRIIKYYNSFIDSKVTVN